LNAVVLKKIFGDVEFISVLPAVGNRLRARKVTCLKTVMAMSVIAVVAEGIGKEGARDLGFELRPIT